MKGWWLLLCVYCQELHAVVVDVPPVFRLYGYDVNYVSAINKRVFKTITTDTNQLLLQKFSRNARPHLIRHLVKLKA
jgi:hypothetical protein